MSTRAAIVMQVSDSEYAGIYCHFDGYPSGVGKVLQDHYGDKLKVEKLIALGDISALRSEVEPKAPEPGMRPHSFDHPQSGVTVAYGRDRGEKGVEARRGNLAEVVSLIDHQHLYVYTLKGKWLVDPEVEQLMRPAKKASKKSAHDEEVDALVARDEEVGGLVDKIGAALRMSIGPGAEWDDLKQALARLGALAKGGS